MKFTQGETIDGVKMFVFEYENEAEKIDFFMQKRLLKSTNPTKEELKELAEYDHEIYFWERNGCLDFDVKTVRDGVLPIKEFCRYTYDRTGEEPVGPHSMPWDLRQVSTHRIKR